MMGMMKMMRMMRMIMVVIKVGLQNPSARIINSKEFSDIYCYLGTLQAGQLCCRISPEEEEEEEEEKEKEEEEEGGCDDNDDEDHGDNDCNDGEQMYCAPFTILIFKWHRTMIPQSTFISPQEH